MANTPLTPSAVTREALRILHQKANFLGSITRSYDSSYANEGAKIGSDLKIRLPNQFSVRTGKTIDVQDVSETSVTLTVATQKGVDINFSASELTLSIDDFSQRYIEPAMSVLVANMEADAMAMGNDVYQSVWNGGSALTMAKVLAGRKILQDSLTPMDNRTASLQTQEGVDLVSDTKSLFQDSGQLSTQYKEGYMGRLAGFDFMENTLWPSHTRGDAASYVCNTSTGITSGSATITISGGSGTIKKGDTLTIVGVDKVHPESKNDTGILQRFVATADGTTSVTVSPVPVTSGPTQNIVINSAGASKTVAVDGTASTAVTTSMLYQEGAFGLATADLQMPQGVDFSAREVVDGISLRIVRDYDINNDNFPCRIDILYGYKTLRPQLACRLLNN